MRLVGLDRSETALSTARRRFEGTTAAETTELALGDLRQMPFKDASFVAVFSRDTLECVPQPEVVLQELARIVTPGGVMLVAHWDWDTQVFNIADVDLSRKMVRAFADAQQNWMEHVDPAMGRKLKGLVLQKNGLELLDYGVLVLVETTWERGRYGFDLSYEVADLAVKQQRISPDDASRWLAELTEAQRRATYFYSANHYWCLARRI